MVNEQKEQSAEARLTGSWRHVGSTVNGYEFVGDRLILRPVGTNTEVVQEWIK